MNDQVELSLNAKIARLVEERGWNMDQFARLAQLSRLTVRNLFLGSPRRLHNATVSACARTLGLTVNELRQLPLERLLPRVRAVHASAEEGQRRRLYEQATQPELMRWLEAHPDRAAHLSAAEIDELLSLQGTGGPLTSLGVDHFVSLLERRRRLLEKTAAIANTDYLETLEKLVDLIYDKIQPYRDRA